MIVFIFVHLVFIYQHQQLRQRPSVLSVSSVESLKSPASSAVAGTAVLGSGTAEVLGTQTLVTRGKRAFRSAKADSSRQRWSNRNFMIRNRKLTTPLMSACVWIPKQRLWLHSYLQQLERTSQHQCQAQRQWLCPPGFQA